MCDLIKSLISGWRLVRHKRKLKVKYLSIESIWRNCDLRRKYKTWLSVHPGGRPLDKSHMMIISLTITRITYVHQLLQPHSLIVSFIEHPGGRPLDKSHMKIKSLTVTRIMYACQLLRAHSGHWYIKGPPPRTLGQHWLLKQFCLNHPVEHIQKTKLPKLYVRVETSTSYFIIHNQFVK